MDKAALDAALTALAQSVADAAQRVTTATIPIDLTSEVNTVNSLKAQVDQLAIPAAPTA